jgi:hypothetical protein
MKRFLGFVVVLGVLKKIEPQIPQIFTDLRKKHLWRISCAMGVLFCLVKFKNEEVLR